MAEAPLLSVVVPTLDERDALPELLDDLAAQRGLRLEVLVADGGSVDGTPELAAARGARVIAAPRGRACQMNAGARAARGDWLLFLHADSRLPDCELLTRALAAIAAARREHRPLAGHFPLRFSGAGDRHARLYAYIEARTRMNRPYTINGDQGVLIHRDDFAALGPFDESLPFLEDLRFACRVFAHGRWLLLPGELVTSARRFETEGPRARYLLMGLIVTMHEAGDAGFFADARALYPAASESRRLRLAPWMALARRRLARGGPRALAGRMWRIGRALRSQFFVPALHLDLARGGPAPGPAVRCYERWLHPLLDNALGTAFGALIAALLIYVPWAERWADGRAASTAPEADRPPSHRVD